MACCFCTNTLDFCRIVSCLGKLSLGVQAANTGTYILEADFLDSVQRVYQDFEAGDNLEFDISGLNENYSFKSRVLSPTGAQITKTVSDVVYNCFSFETVMAYAINGSLSGTSDTPSGSSGAIKILASEFVDGIYTGEVPENIVGIFHTGKANFLTPDEWQYIEVDDVITGIEILLPLDDQDIIYIF